MDLFFVDGTQNTVSPCAQNWVSQVWPAFTRRREPVCRWLLRAGRGLSSLHSPVCRVAKCRLSVANIFVTHQAKPGCLSLMPRFLPPHIRQCFAATRRTIIMHYAVNTVIIYVNIKLFKEMRGLKEKYWESQAAKVLGETVTDRVLPTQYPVPVPLLTIWQYTRYNGHHLSSPGATVTVRNMSGHPPAVSAVRSAVVESVGDGPCSTGCRGCGQESLARAECPPSQARRQSDVGHRTVNISRDTKMWY